MQSALRILAGIFRPRREVQVRELRAATSTPIQSTEGPIGLIAGNGSLPRRFIQEAQEQNREDALERLVALASS